MLRRLLILVGLLVVVGGSACIVRHHHGPPPPGPPPHHRCHEECVLWAHERHCDRRCRVWTGGVCVAWEQHCGHRRVCRRHETRCH